MVVSWQKILHHLHAPRHRGQGYSTKHPPKSRQVSGDGIRHKTSLSRLTLTRALVMKMHRHLTFVKLGSEVSPHKSNELVMKSFCCDPTWSWTCILAARGQHMIHYTLMDPNFEMVQYVRMKHLKKTKITKVKDKPYWELNFRDELKILRYHKQQLWLCIIWVHLQGASSTDSTVFSAVLRFDALKCPPWSLSDSADCDTGFIAHLVL